MSYIEKSGLKVDSLLVDFIEKEAIPGTKVTPEAFWSGLAGLVKNFAPRNRELLAIRDKLQSQIDDWHRNNGPVAANPDGYQRFLKDIGYLVDERTESALPAGRDVFQSLPKTAFETDAAPLAVARNHPEFRNHVLGQA